MANISTDIQKKIGIALTRAAEASKQDPKRWESNKRKDPLNIAAME